MCLHLILASSYQYFLISFNSIDKHTEAPRLVFGVQMLTKMIAKETHYFAAEVFKIRLDVPIAYSSEQSMDVSNTIQVCILCQYVTTR